MSDEPSLRVPVEAELETLRRENAALQRIIRRVWRAVWVDTHEDVSDAFLAGLKAARFASVKPAGRSGSTWKLTLPSNRKDGSSPQNQGAA